MTDYKVLIDHGDPNAISTKPAVSPLPVVLTVQDGVPVIYGEGTWPTCGIRVVHPMNPKAPSKNHSVVMLYVPPHAKLDLHSHVAEETYSVISGTGTLMFRGGTRPIQAGDHVYLPSWCEHGIENTGTEVLVALLSTSPTNP